jgi:hypothetical protein
VSNIKRAPVQLALPIGLRPKAPAPVVKPQYQTSERCRQVVREWQILLQLEGRVGKTLGELAAMTEASTRTIRRDLAVLEEAGFPLVNGMTESGKRWRVELWRNDDAPRADGGAR